MRELWPDAVDGAKLAGAAANAARAEPKRSSSALRIRGPTPEINASRNRLTSSSGDGSLTAWSIPIHGNHLLVFQCGADVGRGDVAD